jgi:hypothetical protein
MRSLRLVKILTALSMVLLTQCSGASSDPLMVVNACDKIRMPDYSTSFQVKLAAEMPKLPREAQKVIVDAGEMRADLRACRSATH